MSIAAPAMTADSFPFAQFEGRSISAAPLNDWHPGPVPMPIGPESDPIDAEEMDALANRVRRELAPTDTIEDFLVDRIVADLRRVHEAQAALDAGTDCRAELGAQRLLALRLNCLDRYRRHRLRDQGSEPLIEAAPPVEVEEAYTANPWQGRLVFDPNVSESAPVVVGTYITTRHVASLVVDGWSWAEIRRAHPELAEDDIRACLAYAIEEESPEMA